MILFTSVGCMFKIHFASADIVCKLMFMLPFFVWLDWKGWFRSDPLEEIVGLDTSYHGGLMLGGEDHIGPEHVSAFNARREENARRRSLKYPHITNTILEEHDHDAEDEEYSVMEQSQYGQYDESERHHKSSSRRRESRTKKEKEESPEREIGVSVEL